MREPLRPSCKLAPGSVAIATAIRSSRLPSLDYAVRRFAGIVLDHYLEQLHLLGRELSLSDDFVPVSKNLIALSSANASAAIGAQSR